jgi:DUF4097 and DUF4098 domain-containing protein YvlB
VNGSVRIEREVTAQDVSTVNGSIEIGERSRVQSVGTVNGGVRLNDGVQASDVDSVNGNIKLAEQVVIQGDITTVNGNLSASKGSEIRGDVENVNGRIEIDATRVQGHLQTTSGDITVGPNSRVGGGILVKKPSMSWFNRNNRIPKIVIAENAVVNGTLQFDREVDLYVSDSAKIGKVEGASVRRFKGSKPSEKDVEVER